MTSRFEQIKKQLSGSTTMPVGTAGNANPFAMGSAAGGENVHYHDGVACTHDHSHDHAHSHDDHDHSSCCDNDDCDSKK